MGVPQAILEETATAEVAVAMKPKNLDSAKLQARLAKFEEDAQKIHDKRASPHYESRVPSHAKKADK